MEGRYSRKRRKGRNGRGRIINRRKKEVIEDVVGRVEREGWKGRMKRRRKGLWKGHVARRDNREGMEGKE